MFQYLIGLLDAEGKKTLRILLVVSFFRPIVDLLSVSLIIPILNRAAEQEPSASLLFQIFGLGIVFLLKGGFELLNVKKSNNFLRDSASAWTVKIYELYNKEELLEHSKKTAIQQIAGVRTDPEVCADLMVTFINITVHSVMLAGYFILSAYVAHWLGIVAFLFVVASIFLLFLHCRSQIQLCGIKKREGEIKTAAMISTAYGAYKEMKLDSRSKNMLEKYRNASVECAQVQKNYALLTEKPGILLQNLSQAAILFALPLILAAGIDLATFLADFVIAITILVSMLPKAISIMRESNKIQYGQKNYEIFHNNMERYRKEKQKEKEIGTVRKKTLTFTHGLKIENLTFHYPGGEDILKDASIEIPAGHSIAIIGSSGVGKSTFLDLILGLLTPQSGSIWYDDYEIVKGEDAEGSCKGELGSIVSYIPQVVYLNGETVRNNVVFLEEGTGDEDRIISCLKKAQIWGDVEKFPNGIDTVIGENGTTISGGQRQRIALARALYKKFKILIMDEATAALDLETEQAVMDEIFRDKGNKTLLVVTHHLALAEGCERIYKIEHKKFTRIR